MEQQNQNQKVEQSEFLRRILFALKKSWWLIAIIVIAFGAAAGVYLQLKDPVYTATQQFFYKAINKNAAGDPGDPNITYRYLDTFLDFCDEGCVVDRANFYYEKFLQARQTNPTLKASEFVEEVKTVEENNNTSHDLFYNVSKIVKTEYIAAKNISASASKSSDGDVSFLVSVRYTDEERQPSADKAKILVCAIENEVNEEVAGTTENKYFYLNVKLYDYGSSAPYSNIAVQKTIIIFLALGVVVALVAVYLKNLFNRTIRDKEELEAITETNLLAYIEDQGEGA